MQFLWKEEGKHLITVVSSRPLQVNLSFNLNSDVMIITILVKGVVT